VYFVSYDNVLRALDRRSGSQVWKRVLPFRPSAGPLGAGNALVVSGLSPTLRAFAMKDGSPAGDVSLAGEPAAPPQMLQPSEAVTPWLLVVTRDIAKGATAALLTRAIEPALTPTSALPNPLAIVNSTQ
jgi:hypothetical protein